MQQRPAKGIGVASFVFAMINMVYAVGIFALGGIFYAEVQDEKSVVAVVLGLLLLPLALMLIAGITLGIISVINERGNRTFGILGVTMNASIILLTALLLLCS